MTVAIGGFALTENERISTASEYRDGVLICRPLGVVRWTYLILIPWSLIGSGLLLGGLNDESSPAQVGAAIVLALLLVGASVGWAVGFLRSQLRADPEGLVIRDRWTVRRFGWDEVAGFGVVEQNAPLRWLPNVTSGFTWHIWPREAIPVLQLTDGRERRLVLLASTPATNGWSLGDVTAAELRARILTRYRNALL